MPYGSLERMERDGMLEVVQEGESADAQRPTAWVPIVPCSERDP